MPQDPVRGRMDAKRVFEARMESVKISARELSRKTRTPVLATVLVGEDPASAMYVAMKHRMAEDLGVGSLDMRLPADIAQKSLNVELMRLSQRDDIDGILLQYPLPKGLDYQQAIEQIDPRRDVDGLHPVNLGKLVMGDPTGILPCTPAGIIELLRSFDVELSGASVVVVGRGLTVGRPLSILLGSHAHGGDALVSVLHSRVTPERIAHFVSSADVVVGAAGVPGLIKRDWISASSILVAAGVSFPNGKAVSDFEDGARATARAWTPTTGGVGLMTRAWLFENLIACARSRVGLPASADA